MMTDHLSEQDASFARTVLSMHAAGIAPGWLGAWLATVMSDGRTVEDCLIAESPHTEDAE